MLLLFVIRLTGSRLTGRPTDLEVIAHLPAGRQRARIPTTGLVVWLAPEPYPLENSRYVSHHKGKVKKT